MGIDIVIPWVDGSDPAWQAEKRKYLSENSYGDRDERFRDWGLLKYWFRCIEKNAPWVRKLHFVTCGHIPKWLDVSNPKLNVVNHRDFLPADSLPCFNCSLIERYLHRIPDLAEQFVYFNDDCFLIGKTDEDFFFKNGLPRDMLAFQPVVANPDNPGMTHLFQNDILVLSKYFDKRRNVKEHPFNYFHIGYPAIYFFYNMLELAFPRFTGLYSIHNASAFLKSSYVRVWEKESGYLEKLNVNRFRADTDVNQYLFREWGKLEGNFIPSDIARHMMYSELSDDNRAIFKFISLGRKGMFGPSIKCLCINDTGLVSDFERVREELALAFESVYNEKSSFEK